MEHYVIYLRKSRADVEAETHGEGETLARHKAALLSLAKRMGIAVDDIYQEIVSGETIAARPMMQRLLQEVSDGMWTGVLVMEVERLARGDTMDQGYVSQTFKYSGTKIITPVKTYDPENEFDEEYFEFGLFMSRREYVVINRRLQRGRVASVKEGKYVGNKPPYGYKRVPIKDDKGFTLEPIPDQADVVKLIFEWYTQGVLEDNGTRRRIGTALIAHRLNDMKIPSATGGIWVLPSVRDILMNPTYAGKVRWNFRPAVKKMVDGKKKVSRPRSSEVIVYPGRHPAIISEDMFNKAQEFLKLNPPQPVRRKYQVQNPLSGLVVCGKCGRKMVRRPHGERRKVDTLMCPVTECTNVSSDLYLVEERVLKCLREWLDGYKLQWNSEHTKQVSSEASVQKKTLDTQSAELEKLKVQLSKTHDLLEQGVYDVETFLQRSRDVSGRIEALKTSIKEIQTSLDTEKSRAESAANIIPKVEHLLEVYNTLPDARAKNEMLKEVLEKVEYTKENGARWHGSQDEFKVMIFPKLPPNSKK